MGALPAIRLSVEEYLKRDRGAEVKSEFHDGEMFPLEPVTLEHSLINVNVVGALARRLDKATCRVTGSSLRVQVALSKFVIPDLLVFCGNAVLADNQRDTITNPKVIVEILSKSTADYDYGQKFILYRRLPSFEEYILISQATARIETYRKTPDNRWVLSTYEGLDSVTVVDSLGIQLPLREVYDGVDFPATVDD